MQAGTCRAVRVWWPLLCGAQHVVWAALSPEPEQSGVLALVFPPECLGPALVAESSAGLHNLFVQVPVRYASLWFQVSSHVSVDHGPCRVYYFAVVASGCPSGAMG